MKNEIKAGDMFFYDYGNGYYAVDLVLKVNQYDVKCFIFNSNMMVSFDKGLNELSINWINGLKKLV